MERDRERGERGKLPLLYNIGINYIISQNLQKPFYGDTQKHIHKKLKITQNVPLRRQATFVITTQREKLHKKLHVYVHVLDQIITNEIK